MILPLVICASTSFFEFRLELIKDAFQPVQVVFVHLVSRYMKLVVVARTVQMPHASFVCYLYTTLEHGVVRYHLYIDIIVRVLGASSGNIPSLIRSSTTSVLRRLLVSKDTTAPTLLNIRTEPPWHRIASISKT